MNLTEEQKKIGRRNFLKAVAGAPALVALGAAALTRGPVRGGPVKIALVGTGDMGRGLLNQYQREFCDLKALCDVNPKRRAAMVQMMVVLWFNVLMAPPASWTGSTWNVLACT